MCKYTAEAYEALLNNMITNADNEYKGFVGKSVPNTEKIIGIRIPKLRETAKEICGGDFEGFLSSDINGYLEEYLLRAMVISGAKMPIDLRLKYIESFVPLIDNWSVCDTLCNDFKSARKYREIVWDFTIPYFNSDKEFDIRFACVILLWHFTTEEYAQKALDLICSVNHDGYYAKMAVAWAVSQFFVYQRDITLPFITAKKLDPWVQNKSIQKIRESFRVSKEDKEMLLSYKIK